MFDPLVNMPGINTSKPNNPFIGDSYYENDSLSIYDGVQWNKMYYDVAGSIRELEIIDRKNRRIEKIKRLFE